MLSRYLPMSGNTCLCYWPYNLWPMSLTCVTLTLPPAWSMLSRHFPGVVTPAYVIHPIIFDPCHLPVLHWHCHLLDQCYLDICLWVVTPAYAIDPITFDPCHLPVLHWHCHLLDQCYLDICLWVVTPAYVNRHIFWSTLQACWFSSRPSPEFSVGIRFKTAGWVHSNIVFPWQ